MKKVKIGLLLIIIGLIVLVGYQNREYILAQKTLKVNLYVTKAYETPKIPNIAILAGFFLVGCLAVYFYTLKGRFKTRRTIKDLNNQIKAYQEKIAQMENEISSLKAPPAAESLSESSGYPSEQTADDTAGDDSGSG